MRVLFISQNLPGEMEPLALALAADPANTVLMASMRHRAKAPPASIRRIILKKCNVEKYEKNYIGYLQLGLRTAQNAANAWKSMISDNFYPDLICSCANNGIAFGLNEFFPASLKVSYFDPSLLASPEHGMIAARRLIQDQQFKESDIVYIRSKEQLGEVPASIKPRVLPLFIDTDYYAPQKGGNNLILQSGQNQSANLYRILAALHSWLRARPDKTLTIIAENALAPVAKPEYSAQIDAKIRNRVEIVRYPDRERWKEILDKSSLCLCAGADPWPDRSLLEIMSAGVTVVAANATSLLKPGKTCLALPESPADWPDFLDQAMQGQSLNAKARAYVLAKHDEKKIVPEHMAELKAAVGAKAA